MNDLPADGLAFLATARGAIIGRKDVTAHFELLPFAADSDEPEEITAWIRRERPRFGRIGLRGGRPDLVALTKPTSLTVPASEEEQQELDSQVRAAVLRRLIAAVLEL